jgi:ABC-2 type transport system ATP-binding protein
MSNEENAIVVKNLTKEFIIPHRKSNSLKQLFVNLGRKGKIDKHKVLNDISFEIKKGEFFGIVGRNGSGKSTLLKILAGVYTPTNGHAWINGSLTPFIELGVGFNMELSGRDNVYLNGALLGFTHKQMAEMYDDIVDFAELKDFMDQKLKNYSSGMQVRLAFSIAIRAQSDILLIDEVLAVGDAAFQTKCMQYFRKLKEQKRTVVLVSHDRQAVSEYCDKSLMLDDGDIVKIGITTDVLLEYDHESLLRIEKGITGNSKAQNSDVKINNFKIYVNGNRSNKALLGDLIKIVFDVISSKGVENPIYGITINDLTREIVTYAINTKIENISTKTKKKKSTIELSFKNILNNGVYGFTPTVAHESGLIIYDRIENIQTILVEGSNNPHGVVRIEHNLRVR